MKKILVIIALVCGISVMTQAQTATIEGTKAEVKKLSKDGYKVLPDALWPMKKQIQIVYDKQIATDEKDGSQKYLMGLGIATESSLTQAKMSARAAAVDEIVSQLTTTMKAIIENNGGIQEKGNISVDKLMETVAEKCKQKMASGPILADFYKQVNGNYIVKRYCCYSYKDAKNMAIEFFESELKNESESLKAALRNLANWE